SAGGGPSTGSPAPTRPTREQKSPRPPDPADRVAPRVGAGLPGRDLVESPGPTDAARLDRGGTAALDRVGHRPHRSGTEGFVLLRPAAGRQRTNAVAVCARTAG